MATRKDYPGHLERHGDQWRLTFSIRGKRHRVYLDGDLGTDEVEAAARDEYNRLARANPMDGDTTKRTVRFSELLDEYKTGVVPTLAPGTQRSYNDTFKPVKDYFVTRSEDQRVDRIRPGNIRRYLTWRRLNRRDGKDRCRTGRWRRTAPCSMRCSNTPWTPSTARPTPSRGSSLPSGMIACP
jgi:hypothetical protein